MTWQQLLKILIESPFYFTMSVKGRRSFLWWMEETYGRIWS